MARDYPWQQGVSQQNYATELWHWTPHETLRNYYKYCEPVEFRIFYDIIGDKPLTFKGAVMIALVGTMYILTSYYGGKK